MPTLKLYYDVVCPFAYVAFTEAAVGAGISTILILGALIHVGSREKEEQRVQLARLEERARLGGLQGGQRAAEVQRLQKLIARQSRDNAALGAQVRRSERARCQPAASGGHACSRPAAHSSTSSVRLSWPQK